MPLRILSGEEDAQESLKYERSDFEEIVYAGYYLSTIKKNPNVQQPALAGCLDFVSYAGCIPKAEFLRRDSLELGGLYHRIEVAAMWHGWKMAMDHSPFTYSRD